MCYDLVLHLCMHYTPRHLQQVRFHAYRLYFFLHIHSIHSVLEFLHLRFVLVLRPNRNYQIGLGCCQQSCFNSFQQITTHIQLSACFYLLQSQVPTELRLHYLICIQVVSPWLVWQSKWQSRQLLVNYNFFTQFCYQEKLQKPN